MSFRAYIGITDESWRVMHWQGKRALAAAVFALPLLLSAAAAFASVSLENALTRPDIRDIEVVFWNDSHNVIRISIDGELVARAEAGWYARVNVSQGAHDWSAEGIGQSWSGSFIAERSVEIEYTVK